MAHYHLDANARTATISGQEVDPQQYPVLRRIVDVMRQDDISQLVYYDAVKLGSAVGPDFSASWGPNTVTITMPWDADGDLEGVFYTLEHLARDSCQRLPHALDRSGEALGPVHVTVTFGWLSRVTVFRGSVRVSAIVGDEHLNSPMQDLLSDWCADMQDYALGVDLPPFIGAYLSKDSVMFRDADLVQHRPEDAPGTENVARELQARFDELLSLLDSLADPREDSE